jgi:hypothetical protein
MLMVEKKQSLYIALAAVLVGMAVADPPTCDTQKNEALCSGSEVCAKCKLPPSSSAPCTACKDGFGIGCTAGKYCRCTWNHGRTLSDGHCVNSPDPPGKVWTGWMGFFQNKPSEKFMAPFLVAYCIGLALWVWLGTTEFCRKPWKLPGKRYIGPMETQGLIPPLESLGPESQIAVEEAKEHRRQRELSARSHGIM